MTDELDDVQIAVVSVAMQEAFLRLAQLVQDRAADSSAEEVMRIYQGRAREDGHLSAKERAVRDLDLRDRGELLYVAALAADPGGFVFCGVLFCVDHHPGGVAGPTTCPDCADRTRLAAQDTQRLIGA